MGKGNKTIEEELEENNQNEGELDFDLYQQASAGVGQNKALDNNLERKDSFNPLFLNKFTSVYAPLPIRREQSFQYLVDPSLGNSIENNNFLQMGNNDNNYQDTFMYSDLIEQKDDEIKRQNSLFFTRNESNNFNYKDMNQDGREDPWINMDDNENNKNNQQINSSKNLNNNLNRGSSQIQRFENVVSDEESNDDGDVQELQPEQFIQLESTKNIKKNKQQEEVIEITGDNYDDEDVMEIFSDDVEDQKKSNQSIKSIKVVDLETMEEEKKKKMIKPIRKNNQILRDYIDIEDDSEVKENYKLTHAEEFGIVSNMNDWMNLSRNNMKLRLLNRKYQSELNREKNVQIKKTKSHQEIFERIKKKMKKLIGSNSQLVDSNKESERRYQETALQLQRVTADLAERQKYIQDLHSKYTKNETEQINLKTQLENKTNEVEYLKESIRISEETVARIQQKKILFENTDNIQKPLEERSVYIKEIQQKLDELDNRFGNKSLGVSSSDDMFKIFCVLHNKIINMQQDILNKEQNIRNLEKYQEEKDELQLRARIAEEQLEVIKKNNQYLTNELSLKESSVHQLQIQVRNAEQTDKNNDKLQSQVNNLQQQLLDKERLLMEQEVIHQIKIDYLLDSINNPQLKSSLKKQLEELMDINQLTSQQFTESKLLPSQITNSNEMRTKPQTTDVKINKKKDLNEESILLKNTLNKLFNWEIQYVSDKPVRFNLVDKRNDNKKPIKVNIEVNSDGELVITNKKQLLKSVRDLCKILNSDMHMISLRGCVENFWLITALQLKEYLINEEKEINKSINIQSLNQTSKKDMIQEDQYQDNSSSQMQNYPSRIEQENPVVYQSDKRSQNIEIDQINYQDDKLKDEDEEENESEQQVNQIIEEDNVDVNNDIDDEEEEEEEYEDDEVIDDEDNNDNENEQSQSYKPNNNKNDEQDDDDDYKLLNELQDNNSDIEEGEDNEDEMFDDEDQSQSIQQEEDEDDIDDN